MVWWGGMVGFLFGGSLCGVWVVLVFWVVEVDDKILFVVFYLYFFIVVGGII